MEINKALKDEIWDYCRVNNISNIDEFTLKLIRQGFTIEKFGATPQPREKIVEVEKVVEKIVEKVVEKIVEVPVEKIVEKEVYITDNEEAKKLSEKIIELENLNKLKSLNIDNSDKQLAQLKIDLDLVKKELVEEKKKNKKDIYGENN